MGSIRKSSWAFIALVAISITACSADDDADSTADAGAVEAVEAVDDATSVDAGDRDVPAEGAEQESAQGETAGSDAPAAPLGLGALGRAIAVEAGITIGTSNIRDAVDDTLRVVAGHGGSVFRADVQLGEEHSDGTVDGTAQIVVKVDPAELDPLIADLDGAAGTLLARTQDSDDVTDQLVDLEIRIRIERNTIERYETLLAQAVDFDDVVAIERVIAERTISLEQLLAAERNLDQRVAQSTLTIDLRYAPLASVVVDDESDDGLTDAFRRGWDVFVGALFAVGFLLAIAAPFLGVAVVAGAVVWLTVRRRSGATPVGPRRPAVGGEHEVADRAVGEDERRAHAGVGDDLR